MLKYVLTFLGYIIKKDQKRTYLMIIMQIFSDFLYKGICFGYSFELHRQVDAIQIITHNISRNIHIPLLCYDHWQYNSDLLYQQTKRNTFSQPMRRGMGDPPLVSGTWYHDQSSSYSRQIQYIGRPSLEIGQTSQNRMGLGQSVVNSIFQMLNYPNVDLFATRFNHKLPLYVSPVPYNHALAIDTVCSE